jgi:hypothetical protein
MMWLLLVGGVFVVLFLAGLLWPESLTDAQLEAQLALAARFSPLETKRRVAERIADVENRFPGKSRRWYLRWLLADYRRAGR